MVKVLEVRKRGEAVPLALIHKLRRPSGMSRAGV
jgi:hypothetical protein